MNKTEETSSPGWGASFFSQTTEDVARAVAAAAAAVQSPRPSVVFSAEDDKADSPLKRLQFRFKKVLKAFSEASEVSKGTYNPEVLTSQKRQWASFQLQYLDHKPTIKPSELFESMVVVGLHPNCDIQALQRQYIARKSEGPGRIRSALGSHNQSRIEPSLEPQVLYVYPPEKQLPVKNKDILSFCFPGGVEVHAVERTPSMSELNEIILSQERLKPSDVSFVFRLQGADNSTLYGCCVLVEELVQKPSRLLSMISDKQPACPSLTRHILTTRRCYCILSRLPFFGLHFAVLNSIFTEERLERLMKGCSDLNLGSFLDSSFDENIDDISSGHDDAADISGGNTVMSLNGSTIEKVVNAVGIQLDIQNPEAYVPPSRRSSNESIVPVDHDLEMVSARKLVCGPNLEDGDINVDIIPTSQQVGEGCLPNPVHPLTCYGHSESSEPSSSSNGFPSKDTNSRGDNNDTETEVASFSGQEDSSARIDILEPDKTNNNGPLQILCEYYQLQCPARGTTLKFHPLEHLHSLEYHRPDEAALYTAGSAMDLRSCNSSLEFAEAHATLLAEEEATALSIWTVACLCGSLRLENVLTIFAGALLEKQIGVVCSNLGILSASVLSIIPLIRPYRWQSLLMPVLPDEMLEFLDAPVPYIVGVKNRTTEVQSKLTNAIMVDVNKNQVKSPSMPQLPQHKELFSSLSPYHAKLVGESFLAKKRPVYECTDVQVEAAKGFLTVLRSYLDNLCSNLRSHTITNVQSNNDKVSLLFKESFIDSFPSRDRPFMKHFLDTQLFSVHTDLVLSYIQKQ